MNQNPFKPSVGAGDFKLANQGIHSAVLVAIADEGQQVNQMFGSVAQKVSLGFEVVQDGEPLIVWKQYTNSIGPKATLRKDLESWRGAPFTKEEAENFILTNVLGRTCQIQIMHKDSKDGSKTFANINSVLPKAGDDLKPETEPFTYTIQDPQTNFEKLPKFIQNRVNGDQQPVSANDYSETGQDNTPPAKSLDF